MRSTLIRWIAVSAACMGCGNDQSSLSDGGDPGDGALRDALNDVFVDDAIADASDAMPDAMPDAIDAPMGALAQMCGAEPTTPAQWEQCYVKRWCEATVNCVVASPYATVQECITTSWWSAGAQRDFDIAENLRAVADGRASIDVAAFTECLTELSPSLCNTSGTAMACRDRYAGTVANGGACYASAECASPDALCSPIDCGAACCTGTCMPKKQLGSPSCSGAGVNACEPGLVCSSQGCAAGDVGDTCTNASGCDAGNYCAQIGTQPGVCAKDKTAGETCTSVVQCGGETGCVGLKRNVGAPLCRRLTEVGDACDDYCLGPMYCALPASGLGQCRLLPSGEEPCNALLPCLGVNQQCSNGSCIPRLANGANCSDPNLVCEVGHFCTSALGATPPLCRPQFADGESGCTHDYQCRSHLCSGSPGSPGQCLAGAMTCP